MWRVPLRDWGRGVRLCRSLPKPLTGILVFLGYLVVFYGVWIINGVEYDNTSDSADTILKWIAAPLAAGAVYLVVVVWALGVVATRAVRGQEGGTALVCWSARS